MRLGRFGRLGASCLEFSFGGDVRRRRLVLFLNGRAFWCRHNRLSAKAHFSLILVIPPASLYVRFYVFGWLSWFKCLGGFFMSSFPLYPAMTSHSDLRCFVGSRFPSLLSLPLLCPGAAIRRRELAGAVPLRGRPGHDRGHRRTPAVVEGVAVSAQVRVHLSPCAQPCIRCDAMFPSGLPLLYGKAGAQWRDRTSVFLL